MRVDGLTKHDSLEEEGFYQCLTSPFLNPRIGIMDAAQKRWNDESVILSLERLDSLTGLSL